MNILVLFCLPFISLFFGNVSATNSSNKNISVRAESDDATLSVPELVHKYGYPFEDHYVTTEDGYILALHRIPHGKDPSVTKNKVVFLQHGLLMSSADWILAGPEVGLAYILADLGYDVWMGNARGNHHSRNHTIFDPDKDADAFWDFSWHEIGLIDLPTMIDYALTITEKEKVFYVGHSQGTTVYYVMASLKPEYNDKIEAQFSLAPIAYMSHMSSPLLHLIAFWDKPLGVLLPLLGVNEFLPKSELLAMVADLTCQDHEITQILCEDVLFIIAGFSFEEMNATLIPTIVGHTPAGSSTKQLLHYGQEINNLIGHFRQYDYGLLGNLDRYHSTSPPEYPLNQITAPVYLFYSDNDLLSSPLDVEKLCSQISDCRAKFLTANKSFNHLDYMWGIDVKTLIYDKLISLMAMHSNQ